MRARAATSETVHDMRNRLAVVRANIEAFIDGKLTPTKERLTTLLQSLNQLEGLLHDINTSPEPHGAVRPVEIDVCDLLQSEYAAAEALAAEKGVTLSVFRCPVKLAPCARFIADPVRIGQIISNVLMNAVRYTPSGGSIRVECTHQADQLVVSIDDTGPGIEKSERTKVFARGVRGSAGNKHDGSGLGLAIAKDYVEAQGGTIEFEPSTSGGARFVVRLPGTVYQGTDARAACEHCTAL